MDENNPIPRYSPQTIAQMELRLLAHVDRIELRTADCDFKNVRECPTNQSTKPLAQLESPRPSGRYWRLSPSEQAFADRVFGSLEQALDDDRKALEKAKAREWRIGVADITQHPRAKPFEAFLSGDPFIRIGWLEKALNEYRYPYMEERLLTPAAFRHLKWLRQDHANKSAALRKRRERKKPPVVLPVAKKV